MAPFKADDVVWRGRENEFDNTEQQIANRNERSQRKESPQFQTALLAGVFYTYCFQLLSFVSH